MGKHKKTIVLLLGLLIALSLTITTAESVENKTITAAYENFSDVSRFQLNGDAYQSGTKLRLTPSQQNQHGSAFLKDKVSIGNDSSFSTYFTFEITSPVSTGADGIVFVIQPNSNDEGSTGGGIGYEGINNSIGIEFDTFDNSEVSGSHVGIDINGSVTSLNSTALAGDLDLGNTNIKHAWIDYNSSTNIVEVRINTSETRPSNPQLIHNFEGKTLRDIIGYDEAFVGFTASTGGAWENHDILSWYFTNTYDPIDINTYSYDEAPTQVILTLDPTNYTTTSNVTATVKDASGNTVSDWPVTFSATNGTFDSSSGSTDAEGNITTAFSYPEEDITIISIKATAEGGAYEEFLLKTANEAPSTPGAFTTPTENQILKGGETLTVGWGSSTDPENHDITYDLWFFNSTWSMIRSMLGTNSASFTLPADNTDSAMFRVYANDTMDNSSARDVTFTIDSTKPVIEISGNPAEWQNSSATIDVNITDLTAMQSVKWAAGVQDTAYFGLSGTTIDDPYTFTVNNNGSYTVYAEDAAGNTNVTTFNVTKIDSENPSVSFSTNGSSTYANSHSTTVSSSDEVAGLQELGFAWNQSADENSVSSWTSFNSGDTLTKDSVSGDWYLHVRAVDNASNIIHSVSNVFKLDNEVPSYSWIQKPVNANTGDNITIELNVTDNAGISSANITVDGQEHQMNESSGNYSWNISIPASDSGTLVSSIDFNCTFTDVAGNVNSTGDNLINVAILPIADFSANVTRGTQPLSVNFTDNSSGLVESWLWDFGDGNTSTDQNPVHTFDSGNFTVNLTVTNINGSSSSLMNIRAAPEPEYTLTPATMEQISLYGDEMNFSINSTLLSSFEWFIDGAPLNGTGVTTDASTDDSTNSSYCKINTSQYFNQDDYYMGIYNISVSVSNQSIGRTDTSSWEWTVTSSSSASDNDDIAFIINQSANVTASGNESQVVFNTTDDSRTDNDGIHGSIIAISFNTTNESTGILTKIEFLNRSSINVTDAGFSADSVYQYFDISFNNETLVNNGSDRNIEFRVLNERNGQVLVRNSVRLRHWSNPAWEAYTPEFTRNDGTYSYFIVRNLSGFSPFAITCDYEQVSPSTNTDDGMPWYLKKMLLGIGSDEKEITENETIVSEDSGSEDSIVIDNNDEAKANEGNAESDSEDTERSAGGNSSRTIFGTVAIIAVAASAIIFLKNKGGRDKL
ncbi:lectin-like domain-containing protein [Methanolobus bombayensis]|uniref:lectin-like domain-containing protein n=1 Tax=Methanolobus bombayensis TaxID=38023 RepID=UPI001AE6B921|nr:PKD domain-containing protein [Methanolobus bombayensis]MBP1909377.1 PKD repeat protein [Methanolobus bombayensis]